MHRYAFAFVLLTATLSLDLARAQSELPVGGHPPAIVFEHFPDTLHAVIWRNWGLVAPATIAQVVGGSTEDVVTIAASMGLPESPHIESEMRRRGYITLIRRNWHLLPYDQLLQLLDMTDDQLAFSLREDDFLFVKLGRLKPQCAPVRYHQPDAATRRRETEIKDTVQRYFSDQLERPGAARFEFLTDLQRAWPADRSADTSAPAAQQLGLRFIYSYFGSYGDPLLDASMDPYPDGLLARLAEMGVNGVWLHTVLRNLAPGGVAFPEFGKDHERRIASLNRLVQRARRHGIGIYLYVNEPRAMPRAFFNKRPEMAGVREGDYAAMCTRNAKVRQWLADSLAYVFRNTPHLAGVFTITASENLTNCASHGNRQQCPRCCQRSEAEIIAEVNTTIEEGVHRGNPDARVIAWDWGWNGHGEAPDTIARLPQSVWLMSVSEWAKPFRRDGVEGKVGEYSMSVVGPGPRAIHQWQFAKKAGLKTVAKVQFNNTWELSAVPFLPVMDLVARHCANLAQADVDGMMLSWTLGGYPSPNLLAAYWFAKQPNANRDNVLNLIAEQRYGNAAVVETRKAWTRFSEAFSQFPYGGGVLYLGPQQFGPANLLYAKPTGYHATMIGFPYDDVDHWRGPYAAPAFSKQFAKVAAGWADGLKHMSKAVELASTSKRRVAQSDLGVAEAAQLHFASAADQVRFVIARDALRDPAISAAARPNPRAEIRAILDREIAHACRLYALAQRDSRLGFEASNHYYYVPLDLVEKVINCVYLKHAMSVVLGVQTPPAARNGQRVQSPD